MYLTKFLYFVDHKPNSTVGYKTVDKAAEVIVVLLQISNSFFVSNLKCNVGAHTYQLLVNMYWFYS